MYLEEYGNTGIPGEWMFELADQHVVRCKIGIKGDTCDEGGYKLKLYPLFHMLPSPNFLPPPKNRVIHGIFYIRLLSILDYPKRFFYAIFVDHPVYKLTYFPNSAPSPIHTQK